ncbi:MAG: mobile mystery protein A [Deltaproteobacteria bacterium]|nr:mobile mystery protein A [Deltaproteobacteria bacterium]
MKLNRNILHQQRRQLDERLKAWRQVSKTPRPRMGWLKAVRESLGVTTRQLAHLLGTNNGVVVRLEQREREGKVTLEALDRAAQALGFSVVYAIVPDDTLEAIVDEKAQEAAHAILRSVTHTMKLEKQEVRPKATRAQLQELAQSLKTRLAPELWTKR